MNLTREKVAVLLNEHPIFSNKNYLLDKIFEAWQIIWETKVGNEKINFPLIDIEPRAQIIGEFFETVFSELINREWNTKRGTSKEKDIVFTQLGESKYNFEIKTSGQLGGRIYGNRSYNQVDSNGDIESISRKGKSGYYLCINFYRFNIYKIRVGWINSQDWKPQSAQNGQAATLESYVYENQLFDLYHPMLLNAELITLPGIGQRSLILESFRNIFYFCEYIKELVSREEIHELIVDSKSNISKIFIKKLNKFDSRIKVAIKSFEFLRLYEEYLIYIRRL